MIIKQTAAVYCAPTRGRRYFSKSAAIKAEAQAIILKKYPAEQACKDFACGCGDPGWHIAYDEPERYATMHRRMCRIIRASIES